MLYVGGNVRDGGGVQAGVISIDRASRPTRYVQSSIESCRSVTVIRVYFVRELSIAALLPLNKYTDFSLPTYKTRLSKTVSPILFC